MNNTTTFDIIIDITDDTNSDYYYDDDYNTGIKFNMNIKSLRELLKQNRLNYKIMKKANLRLKKNKYFNNYY